MYVLEVYGRNAEVILPGLVGLGCSWFEQCSETMIREKVQVAKSSSDLVMR